MKAAIALTVILSLGCVSASPTFGALVAGKSIAASASSSSSYSSSSSFSYYSSEVCTAVGFTIREDLATTIFDELEQQFLQKKCELLNSYGVYPRDIGPLFCDLQPDSLYYDIIILGSGPAGLSALSTLAALGKKILVVDRGYFASAAADSLYYRSSLYASEYVNTFPGYINGGQITKNLYTSNVFGGLSVLDTNAWNIGSRYLYDELALINDEFSWEKIQSYYSSLECYKSYSQSVSVTTSSSSSSSSSSSYGSSSFGGSSSMSSSSQQQSSTTTTTTYQYSTSGSYSIYNSFKECFLTRTLSSVFDELGYCNCDSPFDLLPNKYTILPVLGDQDRPTCFPHYIFNSLEQYRSNIDIALRTTANQIIFNGKRASGLQVLTPSGQQITVYANEQVILSTGVISTYELLFKSGIGPQDLLNQYNIPVNFPIPSMGNGLVLPPVYHGLCLKFPRGYLMNDGDSDLRNLAYAFGDYELSSSLSLNYYRSYMSVKGASEANVALKFYAFSQSTSIRLRSMMSSYFQFDSYTQEYISSMISEYDILIVGTQLLAPRSRGLITYKDCIEKPYIDLGMYSDIYDIECMTEAIEQVRLLAQTKTFLNLNCELVQFPLQNCNGDFFTQEFNKQSILYHSVPSLYPSGGFQIGLDYQTAVVDKALRVLGTENLRLFSPCTSPYSLYSDSLAFSTFIGSYGAQVIANEYNGQIFPFIDISGSSISVSSQSSSYASRDVDVSASSSYSSTDINSISGAGGSIYSASSTDMSSNYDYDAESCSASYINNGLGAGSSIASSSSSSSSGSDYSADYNSSSSVIGGNGYCSEQSSSSSSSSSDYSADSYNSSSYVGAGGVVASESSSSSYDAQNSSSNVSSSSYSSGMGGVQASNYQASSESSSVSAQQESSSYIASGSGVIC